MAIDNHYSDIILTNLVESFGWEFSEGTGSVKKNVGGGATNGELNPTGVRIVTAIFDEPARRYLTLQSGFENILDIDCRDLDAKDAAGEFDSRVHDWAMNTAEKLEVKDALPDGWTEAYRGGIAANSDPLTGGIVDSEIVSGLWFAIANNNAIKERMDGYATRSEAMTALQSAIKASMMAPTTPEGYARVIANKSLQEKYQDDLDSLFQIRLVNVRNALRNIDGWDYGLQPIFSNEDIVKKGKTKAEFSFTYAGAGMNVVGYSINGIVDDLSKTPEEFAAEIDANAIELADKTTLSAVNTNSVNRFSAASYFIEKFMGNLEAAILVVANTSDTNELIGEKLVKSGSKAAVTRANNEFVSHANGQDISVSYIYADDLTNRRAEGLLRERGITILENDAEVIGSQLIKGNKYNVAITSKGERLLPERYFVGAVYTGIIDESKGVTKKYGANFTHHESNTSLTVKQVDLDSWFADAWIKEFDANELVSDPVQPLVDAYVKAWGTATNIINNAIATIDWNAIVDEASANGEYKKAYSLVQADSAIPSAAKELEKVGIATWDNRLSFISDTPEFNSHRDANMALRAASDKMRTIAKEKRIESGKSELALLNSDSSLEDMAKAIYKKHGIDVGDGSSGYLTKLTTAIQNKEVEYLRSVLGNKDNLASTELFTRATGIKLPLTQRDTLKKIDEWSGITPDSREAIELKKAEKRNHKNQLNEVISTWDYLKHNQVRLSATEPSVPVQQWIRELSTEGKNYIFSSKSGVATNYYLSKDESGTGGHSIKNKNWSLFLKAAKAVGGLQQALNAVDAHLKQMAESEASKPDENIAAAFAP